MWQDDHYYASDKPSRFYARGPPRAPRGENFDPFDVTQHSPDLSTLTDEQFNRRLRSMRREHARTMAQCSDAALHGYDSAGYEELSRRARPHTALSADYTLAPRRSARAPSPPDYGDFRYKTKSVPKSLRWTNGGQQLVPAHSGRGRDEGMSAEARRQRAQGQARRDEVLHVMQAPFSFEERERLRRMDRTYMRRKHAALVAGDFLWPNTDFKANPFPKRLFDRDTDRSMKVEEKRRQRESLLRAEEMLQSSRLPPNMLRERKAHRCDVTGWRSGRGNEPAWTAHDSGYDEDSCPVHDQYTAGSGTRGQWAGGVRNEGGAWRRNWASDDIGTSTMRSASERFRTNHLSRSHTDLSDFSSPSRYSTHESKRCSCSRRESPWECEWTEEMEAELQRYEEEERRRQRVGHRVPLGADDSDDSGCSSRHCITRSRPMSARR